MGLGNKYSKRTKHVISVGGGVSSTLELPLHVISKYGADNVDMVIAALAGESPDLWRMVDWIERETGVHVYRVAWQKHECSIHHGLTAPYWIDAPSWAWSDIWDVFEHVGRMGNSLADPCSRVLKRDTLRRFILDHYAPHHTVMHVGITAEEIDRMMAIQRNWSRVGIEVRAELADVALSGASAERAQRLLGWIPEVYAWGGSHNNCGGFCVKAGHQHMARFLNAHPDLYAYHERRELEFQRRFNTDATIMRDRKQRNGKVNTYPLTLRAFRQRMEARWAQMLPGFNRKFEGLDPTPACSFCEAVA